VRPEPDKTHLLLSAEVLDSFVEVPGGSVFVRRWSAGHIDRPPIIILHDSLGSVEQWRDFPDALAAATSRPVIAYDRLGFGRSTPRSQRPSADFISDEAVTFFPPIQRALGINRFSLFGHSVGGAMALVIAASQREACDAVITEAAQAFVEPRTLAGIRSAKANFRDPDQFEKLAKWHGDKAQWVLDAWTEVWLSPEFSSWEIDRYLNKVLCPVLAIHGDEDEYGSVEFPRRITGMVKGLSESVILSSCGHVPHRERRQDVLRLASTFLERTAVSFHAKR
jgi:pimeloyl-ACP methyl ester carboxylesterase